MAKEVKLEVNFAEFSDDELYAYRDRLAVEREKINDLISKEIMTFVTPDFDPYTRSADRKMTKVAKKYVEMTSGLEYLEDLTFQEIAKRKKFQEEQRYRGKGIYRDETEEEFLERETIITESYKTHRD